jgi:hypothetical protein
MGTMTINLTVAGTPEPDPDYTVSEPTDRTDANPKGPGANDPNYFIGNYVNLSSTGHGQEVTATVTGDNLTINGHTWKVNGTETPEPVALAANETAQLFVDVTYPTTGTADEPASITVNSSWVQGS